MNVVAKLHLTPKYVKVLSYFLYFFGLFWDSTVFYLSYFLYCAIVSHISPSLENLQVE